MVQKRAPSLCVPKSNSTGIPILGGCAIVDLENIISFMCRTHVS